MSKGRRRHRDAPGVGRDAADPADASSEEAPAGTEPVDVDGVRTVAVITVLWAVAFVVLALQVDSLSADGRNWWLWTCLAGVGLGLLGLEYTRKRRDAIEAAAARASETDEGEDVVADEAPHPVEAEPVAVEPPAVERSAPDAITRPIDTGTFPVQPAPDVTGPLPQHRPAPSWRDVPPSSPHPEPPGASVEPPGARLDHQSPPPELESPPLQDSAPLDTTPSAPEWFGDLEDDALGGDELPSASPPQSTPDVDDDEPLLDTTLGGGRRARRYDMTGEIGDVSEIDNPTEIDDATDGGGAQYRGRRARRSDSA